MLGYARKVFGWEKRLDAVTDRRRRPRIPTSVVVRSVVVMFLARLGSLNALEQSGPGAFWRRWLGGPMPSADTVGRVCALAEAEGIRETTGQVYSRMKRMKALAPPPHGLMAAILDGHESHATYRRCCSGCLQRVVRTAQGERTQYYHRHVTLQLLGEDLCFLLDAEPIRPGEGEIAAAIRLFDRAIAAYPRAFDVVLGDALYADSGFFNHVLEKGKHVIAVLKDERRDLMADAESLFARTAGAGIQRGKRQCVQWDMEGFRSWLRVRRPVRVVRSEETWTVRRQLDGQPERIRSNWTWVTTLERKGASTGTVVGLGHGRWTIENEGFNELTTRQHADHVYKHEPGAMLVFLLFAMLVANMFLAFYRRNLKPAFRCAVSMVHVSRQMAAELYGSLPGGPARAPT